MAKNKLNKECTQLYEENFTILLNIMSGICFKILRKGGREVGKLNNIDHVCIIIEAGPWWCLIILFYFHMCFNVLY